MLLLEFSSDPKSEKIEVLSEQIVADKVRTSGLSPHRWEFDSSKVSPAGSAVVFGVFRNVCSGGEQNREEPEEGRWARRRMRKVLILGVCEMDGN